MISFFLEVFTRFIQNEGLPETISALLGLKPLMDGYKIIFGVEDESPFDPKVNFAYSRGVETAVESVPQACLQSLAIVALDAAAAVAITRCACWVKSVAE